MPQLIPFFFLNEVSFTFFVVTVLIYLFSKYVLPKLVFIFIIRLFMRKL